HSPGLPAPSAPWSLVSDGISYVHDALTPVGPRGSAGSPGQKEPRVAPLVVRSTASAPGSATTESNVTATFPAWPAGGFGRHRPWVVVSNCSVHEAPNEADTSTVTFMGTEPAPGMGASCSQA